jgi:predicted RNase H-like nuclease (RuvC/YqgF family)
MTQVESLAQELSALKRLVKQKDKAIESLEGKLTTSKEHNRELRDVLKKK